MTLVLPTPPVTTTGEPDLGPEGPFHSAWFDHTESTFPTDSREAVLDRLAELRETCGARVAPELDAVVLIVQHCWAADDDLNWADLVTCVLAGHSTVANLVPGGAGYLATELLEEEPPANIEELLELLELLEDMEIFLDDSEETCRQLAALRCSTKIPNIPISAHLDRLWLVCRGCSTAELADSFSKFDLTSYPAFASWCRDQVLNPMRTRPRDLQFADCGVTHGEVRLGEVFDQTDDN